MPESAQFSIKEMARSLEMRKMNDNPTVLLLGAQAGALFRSEHFFNCLREFSQRDVSSLSRATQFSEYYLTLTDGPFSEADIHSIFRTSLQASAPSKFDLCLAE